MKVIQGRYVGKIESGKGKLKGLRIATEQGSEKVYLPKSLRAIAQAELTIDEPVRVWADGDRSSKKKCYASYLIPLTPKPTLSVSRVADTAVADKLVTIEPVELAVEKAPGKQKTGKKDKQKKGKQKARKQAKKKKSRVTVQICQKKNCCKKGGDDLWKAFETVSADRRFKLESIGCLGGCKRGPNIRLLPDNVKYRHVQLDEIDDILQTHRA